MLPARNKREYEEIPKDVRDRLEFVWLQNVQEAVAAALDKETAPLKTGTAG